MHAARSGTPLQATGAERTQDLVPPLGTRRRDDEHLAIGTASERPDTGFGLLDDPTNAAVDRWRGEKVLLEPTTTEGAVPRGILGR